MIINNPNLKLQDGLKKKKNYDISNDTISDESKVSTKTTNINKGSLPAILHTIPSLSTTRFLHSSRQKDSINGCKNLYYVSITMISSYHLLFGFSFLLCFFVCFMIMILAVH